MRPASEKAPRHEIAVGGGTGGWNEHYGIWRLGRGCWLPIVVIGWRAGRIDGSDEGG